MYLRTSEGLGQVSMRYNPFAGTLGEPPLPPTVQKFLARVKKNPQDHEAVLLIISFHEEPFISDQFRKAFLATFENDAKDPLEEAKAIQGKVTQALEDIYQKHLRNNLFNHLVKAFQQRIKELETKGWLDPLLIDALLADFPFGLLQVGRSFILSNLPDEITEQILNSRVPETHYMRLGKVLLLMADRRKNAKPAFKERVEQELKKRGQ
jgi:type VI protein secretion system component VasK